MLSRSSRFFLFPLIALVFSQCTKTEGEGGAATIKGRVMVQDYTLSNNKNGEPYGAYDTKVYIIYGNGTTYHDDYDCSYDGSYEFRNLRKGTYKIFAYSEIIPKPADPPNDEPVIISVTVSDKKGVVTAPDIEIKKY